MSNLAYYKSLISDDEVIKALVKESKARDSPSLDKTRIRPNMMFFQRTVSNMVSSNRRITSRQERKIAEEKEKLSKYRPKKLIYKKRTAKELINEILSSQTKFVQSSLSEDEHLQKQKVNPIETTKYIEQKITYQSAVDDDTHDNQNIRFGYNTQSSNSGNNENLGQCSIKSIFLEDSSIDISSDEDITDVLSDDIRYNNKETKCRTMN